MADKEDTFLTKVERRLSPRPSSRRWVGSPSKRGRFRLPKEKKGKKEKKEKKGKELKDLPKPVIAYDTPTPSPIELTKPVYQKPQIKPASNPISVKPLIKNVAAPIDKFKAADVEFPEALSKEEEEEEKEVRQSLKYFPELKEKDSTSFEEEIAPFYGSKEALRSEVKKAHKAMEARVGKEKADYRYGEAPDFKRTTEQVPIKWTEQNKIGGSLGRYAGPQNRSSENPLIKIAKDAQILTKNSTKDKEKEKKLLFDKVIGHEVAHHVLGDTQSSISDHLPSKEDLKELKSRGQKTNKIINDREIGQAIGQLKRHIIQYAFNNPKFSDVHGFNSSGQITPKLLDKLVEKGWPRNEDGTEYIPKLDNTWEGKEIRGLLRQLKGWKELNPKKYKSLIDEMTKLLPEYVKTNEPPKRFFPEQLT